VNIVGRAIAFQAHAAGQQTEKKTKRLATIDDVVVARNDPCLRCGCQVWRLHRNGAGTLVAVPYEAWSSTTKAVPSSCARRFQGELKKLPEIKVPR